MKVRPTDTKRQGIGRDWDQRGRLVIDLVMRRWSDWRRLRKAPPIG
jgi:hypothetical protein